MNSTKLFKIFTQDSLQKLFISSDSESRWMPVSDKIEVEMINNNPKYVHGTLKRNGYPGIRNEPFLINQFNNAYSAISEQRFYRELDALVSEYIHSCKTNGDTKIVLVDALNAVRQFEQLCMIEAERKKIINTLNSIKKTGLIENADIVTIDSLIHFLSTVYKSGQTKYIKPTPKQESLFLYGLLINLLCMRNAPTFYILFAHEISSAYKFTKQKIYNSKVIVLPVACKVNLQENFVFNTNEYKKLNYNPDYRYLTTVETQPDYIYYNNNADGSLLIEDIRGKVWFRREIRENFAHNLGSIGLDCHYATTNDGIMIYGKNEVDDYALVLTFIMLEQLFSAAVSAKVESIIKEINNHLANNPHIVKEVHDIIGDLIKKEINFFFYMDQNTLKIKYSPRSNKHIDAVKIIFHELKSKISILSNIAIDMINFPHIISGDNYGWNTNQIISNKITDAKVIINATINDVAGKSAISISMKQYNGEQKLIYIDAPSKNIYLPPSSIKPAVSKIQKQNFQKKKLF